MEIIKFLTAGSVDDGKSTLIGRLLYETSSLKEDQVEAVTETTGDGEQSIDFALVTDGLSAEQEQGITIDVSYKYFSTTKRRFIIADCPGHSQYTRNMVTGASTSDLILLLINAEKGIAAQTKLHFEIANLLHIKHLIVCVNKMDLVNFQEDAFETIKKSFNEVFDTKGMKLYFIPTCATLGDNIVKASDKMNWYSGLTILELLNEIDLTFTKENVFRFPVQYVTKKNDTAKVTRYYLGNVVSGSVSVGDEVMVLPNGEKTKVKEIMQYETALPHIANGAYGGLVLSDEIDVSRGDVIVKISDKKPQLVRTINARLCWVDGEILNPMLKYRLRQGTNTVFCKFNQVNSGAEFESITLNTLFNAEIAVSRQLVVDTYEEVKNMGAFIIIDPNTNNTVAGGVII